MLHRCTYQAVATAPARVGRVHSPALQRFARPSGIKTVQTKYRVSQVGRLCVASSVGVADKQAKFELLDSKIQELRSLPPSEQAVGNLDASSEVLKVLGEMKTAELLKKFGSVEAARRRIFPRELTSAGIKNPESIGTPSVRNDFAFLTSVVGVTSVLAVVSLAVLPQGSEIALWVPFLIGGVAFAVLAIGSVAPGLLEVFINFFSQVFPDYRERVAKHEAAHFLVAYLCGVPATGYSLDLGKEHTDLIEAKLQRRLSTRGKLAASEVDALALVACAGIAAEAMNYEEVTGQNADLLLLQRIINRSEEKLNQNATIDLTRWAVCQAATLLKENQPAFDALSAAMKEGASVSKCIEIIESA
mmetsp:Transcript_7056/g.14229  ORF Transcript_7056/g.14229 Transcript_7056/m.14229 type:complete len:360 (-) Transcript_7056:112-1191(-)|eukprot:CAMPEP_0118935318 /NCGR_PEP_ID=MMETSP1169-20130426/15402_1 /TAXON_ID=36882 /ORGANISM="Pyramimonas obovata, Strain CCMP722" /LENGTH=359 /DNA_ID=CAMNT_0006878337 /DNA_START=74 /DNA_END=1153 /DNA_ORIENTATION=-